MTDFNSPEINQQYEQILLDIRNLNQAVATLMDSRNPAPANIPLHGKRWDNDNMRIQEWTGTAWGVKTLGVLGGGTGASTPAGARSNLGLGTAATQEDSKYANAAHGHNGVDITGTVPYAEWSQKCSAIVIMGGGLTGGGQLNGDITLQLALPGGCDAATTNNVYEGGHSHAINATALRNSSQASELFTAVGMNNHRLSGDHDGRYYTKSNIDVLLPSYTLGAVGTYGMLFLNSSGTRESVRQTAEPGDVFPGSALLYSAGIKEIRGSEWFGLRLWTTEFHGNFNWSEYRLDGSWQCMGHVKGRASGNFDYVKSSTLWLRIV